MARLSYLPEDWNELPELAKSIRNRRGGNLNEADRTVLYSPAFARGWNEIAIAVRQDLSLPAKFRELAICGVGVLNGASYEISKHAPEFFKGGGTQAQLNALYDFDAAAVNRHLFNEKERAVMCVTIEMTRNVKVSDATFAALRRMFPSSQEVVEIVGTIAMYNMVSRLLVALEIGEEDISASQANHGLFR